MASLSDKEINATLAKIRRYDIKIPQEDQEKIKNVADAAKYIEEHKK